MIWSNWQKAIFRGAIVVGLCWTGLAWTQSPGPRCNDCCTERIMVVHEGGKSTRCRILESWQLPDGRVAHLLQALESGEMITIVDDCVPELVAKGKGAPKRIFAWGAGRRTPPVGSPVPPQLRLDSGIVLRNECPPPAGAIAADAPLIIHRVVDDKAVGGKVQPDGNDGQKLTPAQLLEFPAASTTEPGGGAGPMIINQQPKPGLLQGGHGPLFPNAPWNKGCKEMPQTIWINPPVQMGQPIPQPTGPTPAPPSESGLQLMGGQQKPGEPSNVVQAVRQEPKPAPGETPKSGVVTAFQTTQQGTKEPGGIVQAGQVVTPAFQPEPKPAPGETPKSGVVPAVQIIQKGGNEPSGIVQAGQVVTPAFQPEPKPAAGETPKSGVVPAVQIVQKGGNEPSGIVQAGQVVTPGAATEPSGVLPAVQPYPVDPQPGTRPIDPNRLQPAVPTPTPIAPTPIDSPASIAPPRTINPVQPPPPPFSAPTTGTPPQIVQSSPTPGANLTSPQPVEPIAPRPITPANSTPPIAPITSAPPISAPPPLVPGAQANGPAATTPSPATQVIPPTSAPIAEPNNKILAKEEPAKKSWRPGDVLFGWMKKDTPKKDTPKIEPKNAEPKKGFRADEVLAQQNKVGEKNVAERLDRMPKVPFSTAMSQIPPPDAKKPEPTPLAMTNAQKPAEEPAAKPASVKLSPVPSAPSAPSATVPAPNVAAPPELAGLQQTAGASGSTTATAPAPTPTPAPTPEKRDQWGTANNKAPSPGQSLLDPTSMKAEVVKLPAPPTRSNDPLANPERYIPKDDRLKPKATVTAPVATAPVATAPAPIATAHAPHETKPRLDVASARETADPRPPVPAPQPHGYGYPLGTQSVVSAAGGGQSPTYIPVPMMTVPQPNHPPTPPPPQMPEAPQLNAYVNAFTPPPAPKPAAPSNAGSIPQWMQPNPNAMMQQQMMQQQALMQQQIMQQQMIQQQMMQHQAMLAQAYRPQPYPTNPYMSYGYGNPMPSTGPMANVGRQYMGPTPPTPYNPAPMQAAAAYPPASYPPMMPMHSMMPQQAVQQTSYQPMPSPQTQSAQQIDSLVKVMRESPYPAQREWAAQSLMSFEWRAHPQVVPALLSSASQDPAASVRAGCVNCLGRMGAAVEPVFGVLHGLRNDIDPRVRQEVEQAFQRLGQMPMYPQ